ncbi:MAG: endonuclease NucS domain-containing protein [Candidatus Hermodarchaeota archaeon]
MRDGQKPTPAGIIDLFGLDSEGRRVVIEVKKGKSDDRVVGQISRYMTVIKESYGLSNFRPSIS